MIAYRIGKTGLALAGVAVAAMCLFSFFSETDFRVFGQSGLCLPTPSEWKMPPFLSWLINSVLLGATAGLAYFLNRTFNFIRTTEPIMPALFMVMAGSNPWITGELNSSICIAIVAVICLWLLFDVYDARNATQPLFVIATFISIGSMFQYAFLPLGLVCLLGMAIMKVMRPKELLAFLFGIAAPWWIVFGFGIRALEDFHMPSPFPLFGDNTRAQDIFLMLVSVGLAIFMGLAFGAANAMRIYAGNSRVNAMNTLIYWLGIAFTLCIIFDSANITAYLAVIYFCSAVQIANFCALRQLRHEWLFTLIPSLLFIAIYLLMIL